MKYIGIALALAVLFMMSGCSTKNKSIYNKPAMFWYQGIMKNIRSGNLDKADDYYTSLSSEHIESPLLKTSMLILAQAHNKNEEYILANFYLNEYIRRYGNSDSIKYIKFLKIKTNFYAFAYPRRDQVLLNKTIKDASSYIKKRTGKPKAAKIYESRLDHAWYKNVKMIKPNIAWYKEIFE